MSDETQREDKLTSGQIGRVYRALQDGAWKTLVEIHGLTGDPLPSISAQLRAIRGAGKTINKRRRGNSQGLFEYQLGSE